jgi:CheY-specific phosphatase CheX
VIKLPSPGARYQIPSGRIHIIVGVTRSSSSVISITIRWEDNGEAKTVALDMWQGMKGKDLDRE